MIFQGIISDLSSIKKGIMEDTIVIAKEGTSKIAIRNGNYLSKLQTVPIPLYIPLYNRHLRHF